MKYLIWPIIVILIVLRYVSTRPSYNEGDHLRISTTVMTDPVLYETSQYLKVVGLKVYLPLFPRVNYGDKILIEGIVEKGKLSNARLISNQETQTLSRVRNKLVNFFSKSLPQPMSGLLGGIVLGSSRDIPGEFYNKTKNSGLTHVIVASGTNVSFLVSFLVGISAIYFKRKSAILFVILGIILYLLISGLDAPLIRASLMAGMLFWAQESGRLVSAWRTLFFAAGLMLIAKPDWVSDIGFILSFVSTASIMLFERRIRLTLKLLPRFIKESISTSFAAQIGVSPILYVTFGQFNIWSPLANMLVLWTVPLIMLFGAVGGILGILFAPLGQIILWLIYPILSWFIMVVEFFGK